MIWGVLWGWIFFSDLPDGQDWLGIAVIVAAGFVVLWQPRKPA
jgi:drug/metabolite transporter (DMT)-like permease